MPSVVRRPSAVVATRATELGVPRPEPARSVADRMPWTPKSSKADEPKQDSRHTVRPRVTCGAYC